MTTASATDRPAGLGERVHERQSVDKIVEPIRAHTLSHTSAPTQMALITITRAPAGTRTRTLAPLDTHSEQVV
jgi:hypothetical protein